MNASEKRSLSKEARMQVKALGIINRWKNFALILSAAGAAIACHGMADGIQNLFLGIFGIIIIVVSTLSAVVLNLGLKNGRTNVRKILNILDGDVNHEI